MSYVPSGPTAVLPLLRYGVSLYLIALYFSGNIYRIAGYGAISPP